MAMHPAVGGEPAKVRSYAGRRAEERLAQLRVAGEERVSVLGSPG